MRLLTFVLILMLVCCLAVPALAVEFTAPKVPISGAEQMPEETESFGEGMMELIHNVLVSIRPDIKEALRVSASVTSAVIIVCLLRTFSGSVTTIAELTGTVTVAGILLFSTNAMISVGADTVREMSEYGKLLYPVLSTAMAAQGGLTASAALYAGTAALDLVLSSLISGFLIPMVYLFLALAAANSATGEAMLKKTRDLLKSFMTWCLKTLLTVFTTYMSITGVVSGTTDAAALKATKVTISSMVPVVGGILSDASEAVLVSAGLAKNMAGVYGILALLAVFLGPFFKIGLQYMVLKATAAFCGIFGAKRITELIEDFSSAMGLLLAMTGSTCLLLLISVVCFMKGVG